MSGATREWAVESTVWDGARWEWVRLSAHRSREAAVRASERAQRRDGFDDLAVRIVETIARDGWAISTTTEVAR